MIDLHSHVLPGLDDGPADLEGSVTLARAAATAGTVTLVATPHIRADYQFDPARIRPAVEELTVRLVEEGVSLDVVTGGEVSITSLLELDDAALDAVRLADGRSAGAVCSGSHREPDLTITGVPRRVEHPARR